ncbi:unnamed protein product, partial [marine sediment metagenome]
MTKTYSVADFETRSTIDIRKQGAFVYAAHPTTEPMCLAVTVADADPIVWAPEYFRKLINPDNIKHRIVSAKEIVSATLDADYTVAQNTMFEYLIWNLIMVPRYKWPKLPLERLHDTMAQLAYHALPMNLEQAGAALRLPIQKDMVGNAAMKKLCKPKKPVKAEREADPEWASKIWWHEAPATLEANINYCCTDVISERMVHKYLPDLPARERDVWLHTERKNLRGVHVDVENVKAIVGVVKTQEAKQIKRFAELTNGAVSGPRSYVALKNWVNEEANLKLTSVDKDA